MGKKLCFTGRRPKDLYGYERDEYEDLINFLIKLIESYILSGYDTFISGGAQGFDQLAFWAVQKLKKKYPNIKNIVYAPCKNQDKKWAAEGAFGKKDYQLMLRFADEVKYINDNEFSGPKDMIIRNHAMVDNSDEILCLYPKTDWKTVKKSGTAECMRYADKKGIIMTQIIYDNHKHYYSTLIA